jgi:hypothetical protein
MDVTKLLKVTQRSKRKAKNLAAFREIEAAHGRSNIFGANGSLALVQFPQKSPLDR